MGRHRTAEEKRELGERARALRAAGRSRRAIQAELRIGDDLARQLLAGTEPPASLRRPRAKDEVRAEAVALRAAGRTYDEIAAQLAVSKSSLSLWLRTLPRPEEDPQRAAAAQERRLTAQRARARRDRDARDALTQERTGAVAQALGRVTARDLVLALAVSYWCEGAKRKPWNRTQMVKWTNSDPGLVTLFLEGLHLLGVERDRLVLRLSIHEQADEEAARRWWAEHTGVPVDRFRRSTLKRHNPRTVRHDVGEHYRGCLSITVLQSRALYEVMDGLVRGLLTQPRQPVEWQDARSEELVAGRSDPRSAVG